MIGDYGMSDQQGMGAYDLSGSLVGNYDGGVKFKDSTTSLRLRLDIYDWLHQNHKVNSIIDGYIIPSPLFDANYKLSDLGYETYSVMFETNTKPHYIKGNKE